MKYYQFILYLVKLIILIIIALISLNIIHVRSKVLIIIDFIFKFTFGLFIIYYFLFTKNVKIDIHDRLIFILAGFVLLALIDYIKVINIVFGLKIKDKMWNDES
jgi:hypothetical protein